MRRTGWRRLGIVFFGGWYLLWTAAFLISRADRNHAISVDEAVTGEQWTAATYNPVVIEAQVAMKWALLALLAPLAIAEVVFTVRWVAVGFRK